MRLMGNNADVKWVNKQLSEAIDEYFRTNYAAMRDKIIQSGIHPHKVEALLEKTKMEAQVAVIEKFKKNLEEEKQREANSYTMGHHG